MQMQAQVQVGGGSPCPGSSSALSELCTDATGPGHANVVFDAANPPDPVPLRNSGLGMLGARLLFKSRTLKSHLGFFNLLHVLTPVLFLTVGLSSLFPGVPANLDFKV